VIAEGALVLPACLALTEADDFAAAAIFTAGEWASCFAAAGFGLATWVLINRAEEVIKPLTPNLLILKFGPGLRAQTGERLRQLNF
jgi:hypothetical protein